MKDRRLTYVLLLAVIVIWIIIGYRFYNTVRGDDVVVRPTYQPVQDIERGASEVYELQLDYADPFLKEEKIQPPLLVVSKPLTHSKPIVSSSRSNLTDSSPTTNWKAITYLGIIRNNQTDQQVGIIEVDGLRRLVKTDDRIPPFTIGKITSDSIGIQYSKTTKYVYRQDYENRIIRRH